MRPPVLYFFFSIVFIVIVQKTCSKAARFQILTEAEKELLQRREADVDTINDRTKTKIKLSRKQIKGKRKQRKKQKKIKQRKNKQKRKKQRLRNKRKRGIQNKPMIKGKKENPSKRLGSNLERSEPTDTQSRSHKQNLLQHVLDIEEKTRGRHVENDETLSFDENASTSSDDNNDNATQYEKTQDNPVSSKNVKKERRQKKKKKKREKKKKKQKKCKYTKRDLEAKNEKTCNRAKERAKLSYKTMDLLFEQIFDESLIYSKVTKREKIHSRFLHTAETFVSNNTICEGNPTWNSVLLNEKLNEFKENIDELGQCFLGQNPTNGGRSETFNENTVGLSKSDREGLESCMETQNKTERCKHCNKKCGEALKNGEICVQRAVRLLEKARRSREICQNQFRKLDKMQQRLVHDMYG